MRKRRHIILNKNKIIIVITVCGGYGQLQCIVTLLLLAFSGAIHTTSKQTTSLSFSSSSSHQLPHQSPACFRPSLPSTSSS